MEKKKRIFVSPSLFASLALLISETVSRAMMETKLPLHNSAVANLGEGRLFGVKIIAEGRGHPHPPFLIPPLGQFKRESRPKLCYVVLLQFPRFTRKFGVQPAHTVHTVRGTSK